MLRRRLILSFLLFWGYFVSFLRKLIPVADRGLEITRKGIDYGKKK
jgi:hypothetical protein